MPSGIALANYPAVTGQITTAVAVVNQGSIGNGTPGIVSVTVYPTLADAQSNGRICENAQIRRLYYVLQLAQCRQIYFRRCRQRLPQMVLLPLCRMCWV